MALPDVGFCDDRDHLRRRHPGVAHARQLRRRPRARDRSLSCAQARSAAVSRGRGRRRQDRDRQGPGRDPAPPSGPPAMLRGARRQFGGVRMELCPPDARDPHGRGGGRERPRRPRPGHLHRALPDPPPAAAGAAAAGRRRAARAADRRARPHRRAVRGVSARGAGRLPDHHPRDRHDQGGRSRRS